MKIVSNPLKILVTGASGFIGNDVCKHLCKKHHTIGTYYHSNTFHLANCDMECVDLSDFNQISDICRKHKPDIIIHCAAIAHQKVGAINRDIYFRMNSNVTEHLARVSAESNPDVLFIFLSSVSVYGENDLALPVSENHIKAPTSDYGLSKLDAEKRLSALSIEKKLHRLVILRLAPVYDITWCFNLDRRVLFPKGLFYMKFGDGMQEMSALARSNISEFIQHLIDKDNMEESRNDIFNVCDEHVYNFKNIIQIFKQSKTHPDRPVIPIPLSLIYYGTRFSGCLYPKQRKWFHACYEKLASSLIFDNRKMLETGFRPKHSLESVLRECPSTNG